MIFGSVCSGIEAASVAWGALGWKAAFFSEIEPFPCSVLAHRFPGVPNLGDMTKFKEWPDAAIDVLAGGTPCQSFSVAGLRRGLDDPRGNLMLVFLAIARRYRPSWIVWENVPGVLSSNGGRDFGTFLGGLAELGYGFAYRILDAQFIRVDGYHEAVPQRRRRVFVVGYLGDWRRAAAVLFEPESLRGNPPTRREAGKIVAPTISARTRGGGGLGTDFDCDGGLIHVPEVARCDTSGYSMRLDWETEDFVAHTLRREGVDASEDGTGRGTPIIPVARSVALRGRDGGSTIELGDDVAGTVRASQGGGDKPYVLTPAWGIGPDAVVHAFDARQSDVVQYGEITGPLDTDGLSIGVMTFQERGRTGGRSLEIGGDISYALTSPNNGARSQERNVMVGPEVRRLTPRECERLQGFPDDWTLVPYRGKPASDGPRYKAIGNSWAVNCARWVGRRIELVERISNEQREAAE